MAAILNIDHEFAYSDASFERARELLRSLTGLQLNDGKKDLVYNRVSKRLRASRLTSFEEYLDFVEGDDAEKRNFVNALTTNLTSFFREPHHFDTLNALALTWKHARPITVWSAACSTGEEAYSIAFTLAEVGRTHGIDFRVLATDLDSDVLAKAARAVYEEERTAAIPLEMRKRYLQRGVGSRAGQMRILPDLRSKVDFFQMNLLDTQWPSFGSFDVVFCRNVLIYFNKTDQKRVISNVHERLLPGGLLFTGHAEGIFYAADLFSLAGRTTYRKV